MSAFRTNKKPYVRPEAREARSTNDRWVHDKHDAPFVRRHPGGLLNGAPASNGNNSILTVSNLHYEVTPKDLTSIFGSIGTLVNAEIKYDNSGRSSGMATVEYETAAEASRAKKEFEGMLAKGQAMAIVFAAPRFVRRSVSAPTTQTLLNRIQKPKLADRFSNDDSGIKTPSPRAGAGPIRTKKGGKNAATAPAKTKAVAGAKTKVALGAKPQRAQAKTAEQLDKELDNFMGDEAPASAAVVADVEMA